MKIYNNGILATPHFLSVVNGWNNVKKNSDIIDISTSHNVDNKIYEGIEYIYYFNTQLGFIEITHDEIKDHDVLWIKVQNIDKLYFHTD